jgi:hypothetical protein
MKKIIIILILFCGIGIIAKGDSPDGEYEKNYFDSLVLMDDYRQLNTKERKQLMEMVREGLGRYPKWYQKELDEKLK